MANNFLYIDDTPKDRREGSAIGLQEPEILEITPLEPKSWNVQIGEIVENLDNFDGIILDWKLTEELHRSNPDSVESLVRYSAEALAQHLRFLATEKELKKDIPIILCSMNHGFKIHYKRDSTGHDLFDEVYEKMEFTKRHESVVNELNSLAEAYKDIQNETPTWDSIFRISKETELDVRLVNGLATLIENKVPHVFVRFLLNEIIKKPGILIDEYILAARLGVDKDRSSDWQSLLDKVINPNMKYSGLLSTGWSRWWADGLIQWWKADISPQHPQLLGAGQRVALLKKQTGFENLMPAGKLKFCASDEYWTVCVATKRPIDIADGLRILSDNPYAWQDEQFISLFAMLDRTTPKTFKLSPLEKERFDYLKKIAKGNG
ncbi:MAG TPA: hypothetical protein PLL53_11410 [Saprospiraceae bacterium]|nr:hypothetical protein [Saprospiraceae bacterium]